MPVTVPASPQPTHRARRVSLGLVWLATALAGTAVVVTGVLVARMDEIFASAVSQGRAFPFTGEAGDQSVLPFLLGCALTALFLTTAALGYLLRGWAYHNEHIAMALPAAVLIIVIVLCTPLVGPIDLAHQQYTHDLYGWWYFPFLIATVVCHLGCLLAAAVVLFRARSTGTGCGDHGGTHSPNEGTTPAGGSRVRLTNGCGRVLASVDACSSSAVRCPPIPGANRAFAASSLPRPEADASLTRTIRHA